jgi:CBS domain-containing protein
MTFVSHILQVKGPDIWSVSPGVSVYNALRLMSEKNVGALLVLTNGELVGILSERDYARKVVLAGKTSRDTTVGEIMSTNVLCVGPEQTIEECMGLMTVKHIRHLPVIKDNALLGVLSIGDVVKAIIADHEQTIEQLEHYITGRPYSPDKKKS